VELAINAFEDEKTAWAKKTISELNVWPDSYIQMGAA